MLCILRSFVVLYVGAITGYKGTYSDTDSGCETCLANCTSNGECLGPCKSGFYGSKCTQLCIISGGCFGSCNKTTGVCDCPILCTSCNSYDNCSACDQDSWHGPQCNQSCPDNCSDLRCHIDTGECLDVCEKGFWGAFCNESCPGNCAGGCNKSSGLCSHCADGFFGPICNKSCSDKNCFTCFTNNNKAEECIKCHKNWCGKHCQYKCPENCVSGLCDQHTGKCKLCKDGWYGFDCSYECHSNCAKCIDSKTCMKCKDGLYGEFCESKCFDRCSVCTSNETCTSCDSDDYGTFCECNIQLCAEHVQGMYQECLACWNATTEYIDGEACCLQKGFCKGNSTRKFDPKTGACLEGCIEGYYGERCDKVCSNFCADSYVTCDPVTGECQSGCKDGWFREKCDFECVTNIPGCLKCYAASNTTGGDIRCRTCKSGYALTSTGKCMPCEQCFNSSCNTNTGDCLNGCAMGWYPTTLNSKQCDQRCSLNCLKQECDSNSGSCIDCSPGYFFPNCTKPCPGNCANRSCHRIFGTCIDGCVRGYTGSKCDVRVSCDHCHNGSCDLETYSCLECDPGWCGMYCENQCKYCVGECAQDGECTSGCVPGTYGLYCQVKCGKNCFACGQRSGICRVCKNGFGGFDCSRPCSNCINPYQNHSLPFNDKCPIGKYGSQCDRNCSEHCAGKNDSIGDCDKFTRECLNGCRYGSYGAFCESSCGFCNATQNDTFCDSITGKCPGNCLAGYFSSFCTQRCSVKCFGEICEQVTGLCSRGCYEGFQGPMCSEKIKTKTSSSMRLSVGAIAGIAVGAVVFCSLIAIGTVRFVRKKRKNRFSRLV